VTEREPMSSIREELRQLREECTAKCRVHGWMGTDPKIPNFCLLYSSVASFEAGSGVVILGMNPAGPPSCATRRENEIPFTERGYSAYLDSSWLDGGRDQSRGQHRLQRAVQGIAMVMAGADPCVAMEASRRADLEPEARIGPDAVALLRNTPSGNIVPYRASSLKDIPEPLRDHGPMVGKRVLCLVSPAPEYVITLATDAWKSVRKLSGSPSGVHEEAVNKQLNRTYRDVELTDGPLKGALLIGLPAVVRDKVRKDVTPRMLSVLAQRVRKHGLPRS